MSDDRSGVTRDVPQGEFLLASAGSMVRYLFTQRGRDYYRVKAVPKRVRIRTKRARFDKNEPPAVN